jgi:hypothetical protein
LPRLNETLEAMARALFKSWFVDFDPVRAKTDGRAPALPESITELFPDDFEDSELAKFREDGQHSPSMKSQLLSTVLRDTLLPKLISGELRVKDAEKLVSAPDAAMADTRAQRAPAPR